MATLHCVNHTLLFLLICLLTVGETAAQTSNTAITYALLAVAGVGFMIVMGLMFLFKHESSPCYYQKIKCCRNLFSDGVSSAPSAWAGGQSNPNYAHQFPDQSHQFPHVPPGGHPNYANRGFAPAHPHMVIDSAPVKSGFVPPPSGDRSEPEPDQPHVLLSYEDSVITPVMRFKDQLHEHGYKVWMDRTNTSSDFAKMSRAIERCVVFVPVLTSNYQGSDICKRQIEFADKLKKRLIPVRMEKKYRPEGWLAFLLGNTLFHDLSNPATYDGQFQNFLEALEGVADSARFE